MKLSIAQETRKIATVSLNEWDARCQMYFTKYYQQQENLIFPPLNHLNSSSDRLAKQLIDYLASHKGLYLFHSYHLPSHVRLHLLNRQTYKSLLDKLLITTDEELNDSNNRMLLF